MPTETLVRPQIDLIDDTVQNQAASVVEEMGDVEPKTITVRLVADHLDLALPPELSSFLLHLVEASSTGAALGVQRLPEDLTTTTAAEYLGVSRPTLMKLIRAKELPSHKVGTHTRIKTRDVLRYKRERLVARRHELEELLRLEARYGDAD